MGLRIMQLSDRIGRRIKLQDLHVLMTVVQAGSMGKAAERLNTSQPNISRSISELEIALGVRLLDRHRHGIEPTEYGRALLNGGVGVFDELRQTVKNIEFLADPAAGEVRIGSNPLLAASFASAVADRLSRSYPRMMFHLSTGDLQALRHELSERNVDLLIARRVGPLEDERLSFEVLFDDSCFVVTSAQSPWARRRKITLSELVNEPWVLAPRGSGTLGLIVTEAFSAVGLAYPRTTMVSDCHQVRMSLLATGRYLSILPAYALTYSTGCPQLKVLPIELPIVPPVGIVTLKNRTLSPVARLFIDTAREVAKPLAKKK
jgi:DNA-binding transcriptional LysR family regulator